jgi:hypothetical protein
VAVKPDSQASEPWCGGVVFCHAKTEPLHSKMLSVVIRGRLALEYL